MQGNIYKRYNCKDSKSKLIRPIVQHWNDKFTLFEGKGFRGRSQLLLPFPRLLWSGAWSSASSSCAFLRSSMSYSAISSVDPANRFVNVSSIIEKCCFVKAYQIKKSEYCFVSVYQPRLQTTQSCSQIRPHTPTRYGRAQGVSTGGKAKGILYSIIKAYLVVESGPQRDFKDRYSVIYSVIYQSS